MKSFKMDSAEANEQCFVPSTSHSKQYGPKTGRQW